MVKEELGMSVIFVSHDISVTKYMSDDIIVLKEGKIYDRFNTVNYMESELKPYTTELTTQPFWNILFFNDYKHAFKKGF